MRLVLAKVLEILLDKFYVPVSIHFRLVLFPSFNSFSTFLNTAISEDVMAVNHSIVSDMRKMFEMHQSLEPFWTQRHFIRDTHLNHSNSTAHDAEKDTRLDQ